MQAYSDTMDELERRDSDRDGALPRDQTVRVPETAATFYYALAVDALVTRRERERGAGRGRGVAWPRERQGDRQRATSRSCARSSGSCARTWRRAAGRGCRVWR